MSQQPKTMQIPPTITLDGRTAVALREYILDTPSPINPTRMAVELIGALELALQAAAKRQQQPQPGTNGASAQQPNAVLAAAHRLANEELE